MEDCDKNADNDCMGVEKRSEKSLVFLFVNPGKSDVANTLLYLYQVDGGDELTDSDTQPRGRTANL